MGLNLTDRATKAIKVATNLANAMGFDCVGTESLLLAIAMDNGVGGDILHRLGASGEAIVEKIDETIGIK